MISVFNNRIKCFLSKLTEAELKKIKEENEQFNKTGFGRWSWFALIEKLANHDITKFDEVCEQNFIGCLNLLSYWREKDAEDKRRENILKQNK